MHWSLEYDDCVGEDVSDFEAWTRAKVRLVSKWHKVGCSTLQQAMS